MLSGLLGLTLRSVTDAISTSPALPPLTDLELDAIRAIAENEFQDRDPRDPGVVDHAIWSTLADFAGFGRLTRSNVAGAFGSLAKKGLAGFQGKGRDAVCWLTAEGHAAYLALVPEVRS